VCSGRQHLPKLVFAARSVPAAACRPHEGVFWPPPLAKACFCGQECSGYGPQAAGGGVLAASTFQRSGKRGLAAKNAAPLSWRGAQ